MAVPQARTSPRKRNMRRSHDALRAPSLVRCKQCEALILPHRVCSSCGYFKEKALVAAEQPTSS